MVETNQDYSPESLGHQFVRDENLEPTGLEEAAEALEQGHWRHEKKFIVGFSGLIASGPVSIVAGYSLGIGELGSLGLVMSLEAVSGGLLLDWFHEYDRKGRNEQIVDGLYSIDESVTQDFLEGQEGLLNFSNYDEDLSLEDGEFYAGEEIVANFESISTDSNFFGLSRPLNTRLDYGLVEFLRNPDEDNLALTPEEIDEIEQSHRDFEVFEIYRVGDEEGEVFTGYTRNFRKQLTSYEELADDWPLKKVTKREAQDLNIC